MVVVRVPKETALEPGSYPGLFTGLEEKESEAWGAFWRWEAEVLGPDGPVTIGGGSSAKLGAMTKGRRWCEALLGRRLEVDEEIDFGALAGRPCTVVVEHDAKDFAVIADILPPLRQAAAAVRPLDEERALAEVSSLDDLPF